MTFSLSLDSCQRTPEDAPLLHPTVGPILLNGNAHVARYTLWSVYGFNSTSTVVPGFTTQPEGKPVNQANLSTGLGEAPGYTTRI